MHVHHLTSVDGEIVFDVDPSSVAPAVAGVRLADGLSVDDGARLARLRSAMSATFEIRSVGASVAVRPRLLTPRADTVAAVVNELGPLRAEGLVVPVADVGVAATELAGDVEADGRVAVGDVAAGVAVAAGAAAWLGSLDGRSVAVEGFGVVGESVARAMIDRGARVVAVSTERGAVATAAGFDVDELAATRAEHGSGFVHHLGLDVHLAGELHDLPVDVLVPGPTLGVLDAARAELVQATLVAPSCLGTYTDAGRDVLRAAAVVTLPDVVTAAGTMLAYDAPPGLSDDEIVRRVERLVSERTTAAKGSKLDPVEYASMLADTFATTWLAAP